MDPTRPKTQGRVSGFVKGLSGPLRGVAFLFRHPRLLPLAAMPALANLLVFVLVLATLGPRANNLVTSLLPTGGFSYYLLVLPTFIVTWILVILLGVLLVTLLGNLIAAPFNDSLSSQVERTFRELPEEVFSFRQVVARSGAAALVELKKWACYLLALAVLFPLNAIPVLGQLAWSASSGLLSFWFLGFEYLDYSFSRHSMTFADRRRFCLARWPETIGQGMSVAATLVIPPFTLLVMPLSVVGATLLFLDVEREPKEPAPAPAGGG